MTRQRRAAGVSGIPRRNWSRRDFLKMSGVGLAGAAMLGTAACGGGDSGQEGGGPTQLVFSYGPTGPEDERTTQELVDRFNQQNSGDIQVEFRQMSEISDEYFNSLVSDFQSGGGDIDVIAGDVIWGAEFASNGWIEDISQRLYSDYEPQAPDAFLQQAISTCSYQNSLWGVPWFSDAGLLYYRQDLLEDAGLGSPPTTFDGLKEIASQISEDAGTRYGFVYQGAQYEGGVVNGCEFIWNSGGQILEGNVSTSSPGTPVVLSPNFVAIDNESAVQGLSTERSMIADEISPREVAQFQEQDCTDAFFNGDAVFMRGWPYMYALADQEGSTVQQDQIGIAALPVAEEGLQSFSCLGGWNMYVNASSDKKDAAWEFIKFMTAPDQQRFRATEGSFLPTLQSLYQDRDVLDGSPVISQAGDIVVDNARSRPVTPYYSQMSERMSRGFNSVLQGNLDPEEAVQRISDELQNIISNN